MTFIDLEKAHDKISREVMWHVLERKHIHKRYIGAIEDMYDDVIASVRTIKGETITCSITIGLHQGSILS